MIKLWGSSENPKLDRRDLDTDDYECIACHVKENGGIVGVFVSRAAEPLHYRVMDGRKEMFYAHREDAMEYLNQIKRK